MKKTISLLLLFALLLSLPGCAGDPAVTLPSSAPTEQTAPTESSAATEPAADPALAYTQAVSALEQAQTLQLKITVTDTRTVGGQDFVIRSTEDVILQPAGSPYQGYRKQWLSRGGVTREYTEYFRDDQLELLDTDFYDPMDWEEFLALLVPVRMFDPDSYSSVTEENGQLLFSDPTQAESWALPEDAVFVSADGQAKLSGGSLESCSYTLHYTLAGVTGTYQAELTVKGVDADAAAIPDASPAAAERVDSLQALKLLDLGLAAVVESQALQVTEENLIQVQAGGLVYYDSVYTYVCGSDSHMSSRIEMWENGEEVYMDLEESYIDGVYEYYVDDELQETGNLTPDQVIGAYEDAWKLCLPELSQLADLELEDLGDFWQISFEGTDDWGKELQQRTCNDLYWDAYILDDLSTAYRTRQAEGTLYIDKYTLLPTAYSTEYAGVHTIDGGSYQIIRETGVSFDFVSGNAYEEIYGELAPVAEPEQKATPLFYQVTSPDGQVMYLLGTIHVGDDRTAWLPEEILSALASADALALEVDLDETERLIAEDPDFAAAVGESYYYTDGTETEDHLDPEVFEQASDLLRRLGYFTYYTRMMRPMLWQQLLTEGYTALDGRLDYAMGVDNRLLDLAKEQDKKIYSIEDIQEHTALLGSFSPEVQEFALEDMLSVSRAEYMDSVVAMYEMWCRGDPEELLPAMEDDVSQLTPQELLLYNEYNQAMMIDRNAIMVQRAIEYLESGETVFFAVGCAHLAGSTGLLQCLEEAGYTVTQVTYN